MTLARPPDGSAFVPLEDALLLAGRPVELFWLAAATGPEPPSEPDLALLSAAERERARALRFHRHRLAFVRRRAALRRLLAGRLGVAPAAVAFEVGPYGKPALAGGPAFNLSHASGAALVAMASGGLLGVDLERPGRVRDLEAVAARVLHPAERSDWDRLSRAQRDAAFTRAWTRKEAVMKATGEGLRLDPASILVGLEPSGAERRAVLASGVTLALLDRAVPTPFAASLALVDESR